MLEITLNCFDNKKQRIVKTDIVYGYSKQTAQDKVDELNSKGNGRLTWYVGYIAYID